MTDALLLVLVCGAVVLGCLANASKMRKPRNRTETRAREERVRSRQVCSVAERSSVVQDFRNFVSSADEVLGGSPLRGFRYPDIGFRCAYVSALKHRFRRYRHVRARCARSPRRSPPPPGVAQRNLVLRALVLEQRLENDDHALRLGQLVGADMLGAITV